MAVRRKLKVVFEFQQLSVHDILLRDGDMMIPVGFCSRDWGGGWSSRPTETSELYDYRDLFLYDRTLNGLKRKVRATIADSMKQKGN